MTVPESSADSAANAAGLAISLSLIPHADEQLCLTLRIRNLTATTLSDWNLQLDFPSAAQAGSGTEMSHRAGSHITLTPSPDADLGAGAEAELRMLVDAAFIQRYHDLPQGIFLYAGGEALSVDVVERNIDAALPPVSAEEQASEGPRRDDSAIATEAIVPRPLHCESNGSRFHCPRVLLYDPSEPAEEAIRWLQLNLPLQLQPAADSAGAATLQFQVDESMDDEAYHLRIHSAGISVAAASRAGFLYAAVSLTQLFPPDGELKLPLPGVDIRDKPRFGYRGLLLDCSRHFHSKQTILKLLELMALYKLNHLHWHLTDDEGWRLPVSAYPQLTAVGAWRGLGEALEPQFGSGPERYGGCYSHADIREIVNRAAQLSITLVPEVDVPGHSRAAIKSLPELLVESADRSDYCTAQQYTDNVLNPALRETYTFMYAVIDQLCELFPGALIHMGGDEVPAGAWRDSPACRRLASREGYRDCAALQGHLLRAAQAHLAGRGRQMAVWEEAAAGEGLSPESAVVHAWTDPGAGIRLANAGYQVVLCPAQYTYLDQAWSRCPQEPGASWAGTTDLEHCYRYEPFHEALNESGRQRVMGIQAALWSERIASRETLEYMAFPRLLAVAETAWSQANNKSWHHFQGRLGTHEKLLDRRDVNYRGTKPKPG